MPCKWIKKQEKQVEISLIVPKYPLIVNIWKKYCKNKVSNSQKIRHATDSH